MTSDPQNRFLGSRVWLAAFLAVAILLLAGGDWYYRAETEAVRGENAETLAAIGEIKCAQIRQWRIERLGDANRAAHDPALREAVLARKRTPAAPIDRDLLRERLELERSGGLYASVAAFSPDGQPLATTEAAPPPAPEELRRTFAAALSSPGAVLGEFFRAADGLIYLDTAVAVRDPTGRTLALLILRNKADDNLFRIVRFWPTPSPTAETLLVQRSGDDVVFLNELRHQAKTALILRAPLTRLDLPAVQASLGRQGSFEGTDYRGVRVLANLRPVPDSPWSMVTKIDADEILATTRHRTRVTIAIVALLIGLAGTVAAYGHKWRQTHLLRSLFEAERRQREAHEAFRTTLYSIGDGVITTDKLGRVREMNRVAEQLTGWREAEAQSRTLEEVFHIVNETTRAKVENPVSTVLREGTIVGLANHMVLISRHGTECPIADSAAPIRVQDGGTASGVVLIFRDQSTERAATKAIRESEERFRQVQKMEAVGQLAGGVAHDFNNILASMLLQLGLLQEESALGPDIHRALKELEKQVQRGATLTRQLLAFSRQQAMELKSVDLNEVLAGLLPMLRRLLGEAVVVSLRGEIALPSIVADASLLELAIINLCVNARDAMAPGGHLTLHPEVVEVSAKMAAAKAEAQAGRFVCLSVTDTGCGMDEATQKRIFEPFFTTKGVGQGTGLGLATVHGILKQHRGWIEVESAVGRGSTFRVYLPVTDSIPPPASAPEKPRESAGRNELILLVEDEAAVRLVVAEMLRRHGYRVLVAADGPEAVALWGDHRTEIAVLFTDMVMPGGMTGRDLADRLRSDRPELKVIIYTGYSQKIAAQPLDAQSHIALLHKPAHSAQILDAIRRSIDHR